MIEADLRAGRPVLWTNPNYHPSTDAEAAEDLHQACSEWVSFAPLLKTLWPELPDGAIRSHLTELPRFAPKAGRLFVKGDHALPVAGSVKARGGVFEVMSVATALARDAGINDLASPEAKAFFGKRRIAVGSTGNLGLSVGIAARALGFAATVHMSHDAKPWKVARLRALGVEVVQHATDYSSAVAAARDIAAGDPLTHFVDDEDSIQLFRGYSAAAEELAEQLAAADIQIGPERPLFLYLPCGIGGAPGGIAYGARGKFGPHVHSFFVEPTQAPSALIQMRAGLQSPTSVYDLGLSNRTEADGMAVATMSTLVAERMQTRLAGALTVDDDDLFRWLARGADAGLRLEPSAASALAGPAMLFETEAGREFFSRHVTDPTTAVHIAWTTGGAFVPEPEMTGFLSRGRALLADIEGTNP